MAGDIGWMFPVIGVILFWCLGIYGGILAIVYERRWVGIPIIAIGFFGGIGIIAAC